MDWTKGGGIVNVVLNGVVGMAPKPQFPVKAQANGVALESLDFESWFGQGIDVEGRVRQPFISMGYTMDSDYSATTPKTLSTYVTGGKQIWYSISHGSTYSSADPDLTGTPFAPFNGLAFKDAEGKDEDGNPIGIISADRLPANLNYRMVICDGCCSAQTSLESETAAASADSVLSNCTSFANAFGPKVVYLGWAWTIPPTDQIYTGEYIADLKGRGVTAQEALQKLRLNHPGITVANLLKIYGNTGVSIDLSSNPNAK